MFEVNSGPVLYSTPDLLAVVFLGVVGGVLGSLYNYLVDKVLRTYGIINKYVISRRLNSFVKSYSSELTLSQNHFLASMTTRSWLQLIYHFL